VLLGRRALEFQSGLREGAAEVVIGIGVAAREAGTSESPDGVNLGQRYAPRKQIFGDPQNGDAPARTRGASTSTKVCGI
jgi:hypothetical protein